MSVLVIRSYEWIHHTGMKRTEMIKKKKRQIRIDFQVVPKDIRLLKNNYMEREREKELNMSEEEEKQARIGNTC